jgi:hypothetical protein
MNTPSSSSRILLLAGPRVSPADDGVRVQRYRLARVAPVRPDATGPRLADAKRV